MEEFAHYDKPVHFQDFIIFHKFFSLLALLIVNFRNKFEMSKNQQNFCHKVAVHSAHCAIKILASHFFLQNFHDQNLQTTVDQWLMRRCHRVNKIAPLSCSAHCAQEISARGGQRKAINSVFSYIKTHPQEMSEVFSGTVANADNLSAHSNCPTTPIL